MTTRIILSVALCLLSTAAIHSYGLARPAAATSAAASDQQQPPVNSDQCPTSSEAKAKGGPLGGTLSKDGSDREPRCCGQCRTSDNGQRGCLVKTSEGTFCSAC